MKLVWKMQWMLLKCNSICVKLQCTFLELHFSIILWNYHYIYLCLKFWNLKVYNYHMHLRKSYNILILHLAYLVHIFMHHLQISKVHNIVNRKDFTNIDILPISIYTHIYMYYVGASKFLCLI